MKYTVIASLLGSISAQQNGLNDIDISQFYDEQFIINENQ